MASKGIIGICGSGQIGRSLAMVYTSAGYRVNLLDTSQSLVDKAISDIESQLKLYDEHKALRSQLTIKENLDLIKGVTSVKECCEGAFFIHEAIHEDLNAKKKLYSEIEEIVGDETILASTTSAFPPSKIAAGLKRKQNFLVNHPVLPPYVLKLMEIVPSPSTSPEVVTKTYDLMKEVGQSPVKFKKEIVGFGFNRFQLTIIKEAWHMYNDGILDVNDIDTLITEGLGIRYAWQGPFESSHLTSEGFDMSAKNYLGSLNPLLETLKGPPSWDPQTIKEITEQLLVKIPYDKLQERRKWRDERLIALSKLKDEMKAKE